MLAWFKQQWDESESVELLVTAVLRNDDLWGQDLSLIDGLVEQVTANIDAMDQNGLLDKLKQLNS